MPFCRTQSHLIKRKEKVVKIKSREVTLGFAFVGLLSYAACTAEKTSMKSQETVSSPVVKSEPAKLFEGVFAASDHLLTVYFDLNKSTLSEGAAEALKANAEWLKTQPPFLIRVVGYADNRGSQKKNERIAQRRAQAVRDAYLALGLAKDRISITGRGTEDAACEPVTEECLSKSRRTDTLIEDKPLASR